MPLSRTSPLEAAGLPQPRHLSWYISLADPAFLRLQSSYRAPNPSCPCRPPSRTDQPGLVHPLPLAYSARLPPLLGGSVRPRRSSTRRTPTGSSRCAAGAATGRPISSPPTTPPPPHAGGQYASSLDLTASLPLPQIFSCRLKCSCVGIYACVVEINCNRRSWM
jgi:hypothetical protein